MGGYGLQVVNGVTKGATVVAQAIGAAVVAQQGWWKQVKVIDVGELGQVVVGDGQGDMAECKDGIEEGDGGELEDASGDDTVGPREQGEQQHLAIEALR